ncbi:hypothetical protein [Bacillus sp. 165]|uniref:hypothetical protein n=1 Tax=Bacillus sp. 165 TaxID=1529117 RepID=UPI001ADD415D|nr:hypothetical protein [Bacillus sp. 165]MBO9128442.1 hypothetical protein [Bacillus sp. 165]
MNKSISFSNQESLNEKSLYEALEYLIGLGLQCPLNGVVQYQCGAMHNRLGLEQEAIVYYEKAIELGLPQHLQEEAVNKLRSCIQNGKQLKIE